MTSYETYAAKHLFSNKIENKVIYVFIILIINLTLQTNMFRTKYEGDIKGWLWEVQDTDDAKHFGGNVFPVYQYMCCSEECVPDLKHNEKNYCKSCYKSYKEHFDAMNSIFTDLDMEHTFNGILYESGYSHRWLFTADDLVKAKQVVKMLRNKYDHLLLGYGITDSPEYWGQPGTKRIIEYKEKHHKSKYETRYGLECEKMLARLCFGLQIVYCLENYGKCEFVVG